jgi:hypothetical protein
MISDRHDEAGRPLIQQFSSKVSEDREHEVETGYEEKEVERLTIIAKKIMHGGGEVQSSEEEEEEEEEEEVVVVVELTKIAKRVMHKVGAYPLMIVFSD